MYVCMSIYRMGEDPPVSIPKDMQDCVPPNSHGLDLRHEQHGPGREVHSRIDKGAV